MLLLICKLSCSEEKKKLPRKAGQGGYAYMLPPLEASLNVCLNIGGTFRPSTIQVRQYKRLTTSKQSSWDEPEEVNC